MALPEDGGEERDYGGPWHDVHNRKNNRSRGDGVEWTFLVQNISDKVTRNIMWRAFRPFGFVSDVYVARKRDSRGRCFGFVRYIGVVNMKETLVSMNTVRMFDMKAIVSLAKYDKEHKKITYTPDMMGRCEWRTKNGQQNNKNNSGVYRNAECPQNPEQSADQDPKHASGIHEGRSFADLFKGKPVEECHGSKVITVQGKGSLYPLHCIGRSVIGYAKEVMSLRKMKQAMEDEGMTEVGLSFAGGVTFLLTFRDKVMANTCMDLYVSFFKKMFSEYHLWLGEDVPFSRMVTLNIIGVPFIIRDNTLFDNIGGLFGEVVEKSSFSWQNEDNSLASVKVITSQASKIEEAVVIKWNNRTTAIWVVESTNHWQPVKDDDSVMDSQDNDFDSNSDSDMESEDVELEDMEELEEGELRQETENVDRSQEDDRRSDRPEDVPVIGDQTVGKQESLVVQGSGGINADVGFQELHGEEMGEAHVRNDDVSHAPTSDQSTKINCGGPSVVIEGMQNSGPFVNGADTNHNGPDDGPEDLGPMSVSNLGKRNRGERSPPSIGSTQGPSQRIFNHSGINDGEPLDLNTPIREISGINSATPSIPNEVSDPELSK
ncbi:putative RNA recognition motif domain, nucleotide-binding alpha-beta plait domain superfamily [Helianthus annuus]|nr:putative RNA recognition motif domain, nucleotide-binding alpha-beta plait domain superfamily [Helianthus annuus]